MTSFSITASHPCASFSTHHPQSKPAVPSRKCSGLKFTPAKPLASPVLPDLKSFKENRVHKFSCFSTLYDTSNTDASEQKEDSAPVKLTYLEGNSWLWEIGETKFLVDPIIVGPLDFGIPWLYTAFKKVLKSYTIDDLPAVDYILITQSLDDHCHLNTLKPLSQKFPEVKVIATPNAKNLISDLFKNITFLEPGESITISNKDQETESASRNEEITVKAVQGPVLGPPWQRPENGYIVSLKEPKISVFIEPHCQPGESIANESADVIVTPIIKQMLPSFTLVSGQEDAVNLVKKLGAKYVVPMANAELDANGFLSALVKPEGTLQRFEELLARETSGVQILVPYPGEVLSIPPK